MTGEYNGDFDNAPTRPVFVAGNNLANAPFSASNMRGYLFTYERFGYKYQRYIECNVSRYVGAIYERTNIASSSAWNSWQRTDGYGTSSLSELAASLGVWQGGNCDNTTGLKAEFGYCGAAAQNKPDGCTAGFKIGLYYSISRIAFIIFFGWKNGRHTMYYGQTDSNGDVSKWYKVTSEELT